MPGSAGLGVSPGSEGTPCSLGIGSATSRADDPTEVECGEEWQRYWYEMVGECYLHGMMDGEAMRENFYDEKKG